MLERAWHPLSRSFESVPMEPQPDHGLGIPKLDLCVRSSRRSGLVRLGISVTGSNITGHQRADSGQVPWITSGVEGNQMRRMTDDRYEYREILSIEENDPILRQPHYSY